MKRIYVVSYGIIENDGRLMELIESMKLIGDPIILCSTRSPDKKTHTIRIKGKYLSPYNFIRFLIKGLNIFFSAQKGDIILIDNFFSAPVGLLFKKLKKDVFVIQDCRECYSLNDIKSNVGRFLVAKEIKLMQKADIVIEANEERADYVKKLYNLSSSPYVFENIRYLPKGESLTPEISKLISDDVVNVISTGGVSVDRGTLPIIEAFIDLPKDFRLIIVGGGTEEDIQKAKEIIEKHSLTEKVILLGKIPITVLSSLVSACHIGVVHYHNRDYNNKCCASGKVYEYMGAGLPIVTSPNDSLKNLCNKYGIGISGDDYTNMILDIYNNYSYYKENVKTAREQISPIKNRKRLADFIINNIKN